jgi:cholest-4-en-3-one 26-monooxygenase
MSAAAKFSPAFTSAPTVLDIVGPETYRDHGYPHEAWTWLRNNDPVRFYPGSERFKAFWAITKHADIVDIGKNPADFIIQPRLAVFDESFQPPEGELQARHLLNMDPPEHAQYRQLASKWFTPRTVKVWEPKVHQITKQVLDKAQAKAGDFDFVMEVSAPITIAVIGLMLGVPEQDWPLLFKWTNETIAPEEPEFQKGRTTRETADQARMELFKYFHALSEERRKNPQDDIISVVAQAKLEGQPLPVFELLSYYFLLVVAGNETTRNAMTGGVQALIDNPAQCALLQKRGDLVEGMIEETVRWVTPVNQFARTATRDLEVRGRKIKQGESVCLFYASGNRDEEIFERPFDFDITRNPNNHIGFGRGEHVCLGAHLARLELRALFAQLRERLVSIERARTVERINSSFVGGVKRAYVRWELRDAARA